MKPSVTLKNLDSRNGYLGCLSQEGNDILRTSRLSLRLAGKAPFLLAACSYFVGPCGYGLGILLIKGSKEIMWATSRLDIVLLGGYSGIIL